MEQALILGKMEYSAPRDIIKKIRNIPGVSDANFIFGPYDFYVIVNAKTKEMVGNILLQIRSNRGVLDTMTCYVVEFSEIRPSGELLQ